MGARDSAGIILQIAYPSAVSRGIELNGELVEYNKWDTSLVPPGYGVVKGTKCGESRYIAVTNILEFYVKHGCNIIIKPRDAIQSRVRMEWTMDAFFAEGGTTKFIDRLAGSLGIHASTIKVVSVYAGSVVANYEISVSEDPSAP